MENVHVHAGRGKANLGFIISNKKAMNLNPAYPSLRNQTPLENVLEPSSKCTTNQQRKHFYF
jgi:hypothetical protein